MDIEKIEKMLCKLSIPKRIESNKWYIKSGYTTFGNSMPDVRNAFKHLGIETKNLTHKKNVKFYNKIWHTSEVFEILFLPIFYFSSKKYKLDLDDWKILKTWTSKIDNWAHSDMYSGVIAYLVENYPEKMLVELKKWNTSKNPWERRLSLTSLIYYSANRKKFLPVKEILKLVDNLLNDEDIYVQKAIGWTLRETGNLCPEEVRRFILKNALILSPTAFTSAVEKWDKKEKEILKLKRKTNRKKSKSKNRVI